MEITISVIHFTLQAFFQLTILSKTKGKRVSMILTPPLTHEEAVSQSNDMCIEICYGYQSCLANLDVQIGGKSFKGKMTREVYRYLFPEED